MKSNTSASYFPTPADCRSTAHFPLGQTRILLTSVPYTFCSWVAIFHLSQLIVFLSLRSYVMPGLAPLMHVFFQGRRTFYLSSADRKCQGTFEIVFREVLWSIWGSHKKLWSLPLQDVAWHSGTWSYTVNEHHQLIGCFMYTNLWPYFRPGPHRRLWPYY